MPESLFAGGRSCGLWGMVAALLACALGVAEEEQTPSTQPPLSFTLDVHADARGLMVKGLPDEKHARQLLANIQRWGYAGAKSAQVTQGWQVELKTDQERAETIAKLINAHGNRCATEDTPDPKAKVKYGVRFTVDDKLDTLRPLVKRLEKAGYNAHVVQYGKLYAVVVGEFSSRLHALWVMADLMKHNFLGRAMKL